MRAADYRAGEALRMKEEELRENIRTLATTYGWRLYFTWRSVKSPAGFPDLVLAHRQRRELVIAELKRELPERPSPSVLAKLSPTPAQQAWLDDLAAIAEASAGAVQTFVWRPSDYLTGRIRAVLQPQPRRRTGHSADRLLLDEQHLHALHQPPQEHPT